MVTLIKRPIKGAALIQGEKGRELTASEIGHLRCFGSERTATVISVTTLEGCRELRLPAFPDTE